MVTWTGLFFCTRGEAMIGHDACRVFIFRLMRPIMLLLAIPLAMGFAHASAEVRVSRFSVNVRKMALS
jgi:hypothetical protein